MKEITSTLNKKSQAKTSSIFKTKPKCSNKITTIFIIIIIIIYKTTLMISN